MIPERDKRRLEEEAERHHLPLVADGTQHADLLPPLGHGTGSDHTQGGYPDQQAEAHEALEEVEEALLVRRCSSRSESSESADACTGWPRPCPPPPASAPHSP
jgi:hypothetical protein